MRRGSRRSPRPAPVRAEEAHLEGEGAVGGAPAGEARFEVEGTTWLARPAGAGCYGTGKLGTARLVAVHFFRADATDEPVREALIPAGLLGVLREEEWTELWARATPIRTES